MRGLPKTRIQSIDMLRGIVMLIMALDHVRDYLHITAMTANPLDPATTTPPLFFTRWITHFCAPVFLFLSGTSAFLASQNKNKQDASLFLIRRGIWLVVVEVAIITLALTFNPRYDTIILQVIWVIGSSMMILGVLLFTNIQVIFAIGLLLVAGHNLLDTVQLPEHTFIRSLVSVLLTTSDVVIPISANRMILDLYAVLPWTGIMLLGYAFGTVYKYGPPDAGTQKKIFWLGAGVTALFLILRWVNHYGEPAPWRVQKDGVYTLLSFLNTTKYPPSLLYTCMTLGPSLMLLSGLERWKNAVTGIFSLYGRVPFFYYVLHFYLIHTLCVILFYASGYGSADIVNPDGLFYFRPTNFGLSLPLVYLTWLFVIAILYLPCRWFDQYRSTHRQWWLSYL